jgi:hypothetical protein
MAAEAEENLQLKQGYCDIASLIILRPRSKLSMQQPHSSNESMQIKRSDQPEASLRQGDASDRQVGDRYMKPWKGFFYS